MQFEEQSVGDDKTQVETSLSARQTRSFRRREGEVSTCTTTPEHPAMNHCQHATGQGSYIQPRDIVAQGGCHSP